jgi:drug/metabolite transporter (DMT)-like permease
MEISLKLVSGKFDPIQLTFIRFFIGGIILLPLAISNIKRKKIPFGLKNLKFFVASGFICVVISMVLFQLAVLNGKASVVAILFSCNPIFVIPLAYVMLKEPVYKDTIASMIISVIGIMFIMNPFNMSGSVKGIIFTLLSAVTFALYGVIGKRKSSEYGGIILSSFSFLMGSFEMLILIMLSKISFVSSFLDNMGLKIFSNIPIIKGISFSTIPSLIYIGIFVTGLGYTFYFLAMEETSASTASLVFYIKPALAPILALIILKEVITVNMIIGIGFIIVGSCITFIFNSRRNKLELEEDDEANFTA